jgi:integrase
MPRLVNKPPSYRLHRSDGRAVVTINGRDFFLGKHGTPESRAEYDRLVGEYLANGRRLPRAEGGAPADPSVNEVIVAFWRHAETHYRHADGTPTGELDNYRDALRPLHRLYGTKPARDFSPRALKAVRESMIRSGLARGTINQRVGRVVRLFRWAVTEELIPPGVHQGLKAVPGLQKGRTAAREADPVKPVPEAFVDAVRPYVSAQVWAMIELQRLTAMRPGEVCVMRTCDLDTSGNVWIYRPARHKTGHRGRARTIPLGPKAQAVIRPWLKTDLSAYLFSPSEAVAEFRGRRRENRKTPLTPSQRARKPRRSPRRAPGAAYDVRAYTHAIHRGCRAADIPIWGANRLRHNAATAVRARYGIEAARSLLGHADLRVTQVYAEADEGRAREIMWEVG